MVREPFSLSSSSDGDHSGALSRSIWFFTNCGGQGLCTAGHRGIDRTRVEAEKHLGFVRVGIFLRSRLLLVEHRTKLEHDTKESR